MMSKPRAEKQEGSLIGDEANQEALIAAWERLTYRLAELSDEIEKKQQRTIPEATYDELVDNPSPELMSRIRECGSVVIRETISKEQVSHPTLLRPLVRPLILVSIERWEDPTYRQVYEKVLTGKWEEFDAWDMHKRADAVQDLYPRPGSLYRSWQGWTSLSETGPTEGNLLVYPFIREHSAYLLMRPLFKPKKPRSEFQDEMAFLAPDNCELDFETTNFPGSPQHRNQELNDNSAAVFYIPAVALTPKNAEYIRDQRPTLLSGRPAPDFPGGIGERKAG
ncbi:hypothetical protein ACJ41O_010455 [Fusarium nematophilum]